MSLALPLLLLLPMQALASPLDQAIELYWNGEYEQTLTALSDAKLTDLPTSDASEARKYRAFSLIALGRNEEARQEFRALLATDPGHQLDPNLVSPKVLEQFRNARSETASSLFKQGKASYASGDYAAALQALDGALTLDPASEMAKEYRELVVARLDIESIRAEQAAASAAAEQPTTVTRASETLGREGFGGAVLEDSPPPAIHISGEVQEPALIERVSPEYPIAEQRARRQGTVVLMVTIDRLGDVEHARVVRSVSRALDGAALRAVKQWRYRPARLNGKTVAVYKVVTLRFALSR